MVISIKTLMVKKSRFKKKRSEKHLFCNTCKKKLTPRRLRTSSGITDDYLGYIYDADSKKKHPEDQSRWSISVRTLFLTCNTRVNLCMGTKTDFSYLFGYSETLSTHLQCLYNFVLPYISPYRPNHPLNL